MITAPQSRAVCDRPAREVPSFHTSSSPLLHPSGAEFSRHPRDVAAPARPTKENEKDKGSCISPPQSPFRSPAHRRATHRNIDGPAALDKPWLAAPPAHGILKRRGRMNNTRVAPSAVSVTGPSSSARCVRASSGAPKAGAGDPNARPFSNLESMRLPKSSKQARHVAFDEAAIKHLDASASNLGYNHSLPGTRPENVEWGTAMPPSYAASDFGGGRPPTDTAGSTGKANAVSWGADSEWFNEEFGAQLTPAAATAVSATATLTPLSAAVTSDTAPFSSSDLTTRSSQGLLPFSSTPMPATTSTAARVTTRQLCMPDREQGEHEAGDSQALCTSASSAPFRRLHSTRVTMNTYPAGVLSGATIPAGSSSVSTSEASSDDGSGLSPVLTYENASFDKSAHTGNNNVVASSRSSNTVSSALPLSAADLRRRSPPEAPSLATSVAQPDSGQASGRRRGSNHRRLLSPSVYPSHLEASLTDLASSAQSARSGEQEAAPVPPQTHILAPNSSDRESPTIGAMKLSAGERRLLQAVMQVNERKRLADPNDAPSVTLSRMNTSPSPIVTVETPSRTLGNSAGGNLSSTSIFLSRAAADDEGALWGTTQVQGDPHTKVLSAEARQFLDAGAPSLSCTTPSRSRVSRAAAEDGAGSADSSMRTRDFGAQLSSRVISAASPTPIAAASGMHGNPESNTIASAETTSGGVVPSSSHSSRPMLPAAKGSDAQASWRDATATAASPALSSETLRSSTLTSRPHSHGVNMSAAQQAHRQLEDEDEDEDESEPHIQVPEPTPRIPAGKLKGEAQRRRCGNDR
ncbi:hypothetical protein LSCM4_03612 [Leishmania orientalis]|uniref:Uncharacterized protein n=1 Tax=Leishmania orientalis TaxID=2249476 RepID=A0A836KPN3_9TRYP|nr:hypothetical protein LSCM4_03612 [Leishmania orientalis]